jgi:hypothetical protein
LKSYNRQELNCWCFGAISSLYLIY